jgi:hypothetical protein
MGERRQVEIRNYRLVLDRLERRLFRLERWRLPLPYGLPLRSVGYFVVTLLGLLMVARLPIVGGLVGLLPDPFRFLLIPGLCAWALSSLEIDGRPPHRALFALIAYARRSRHYAGLRPCPEPGRRLVPLSGVWAAATPDNGCYRAGGVRGPATLRLSYPCRIELRRAAGAGRGGGAAEKLRRAKELRIRSRAGMRPLAEPHLVRLPAGRRVVFEEPDTPWGAALQRGGER